MVGVSMAGCVKGELLEEVLNDGDQNVLAIMLPQQNGPSTDIR